MPLPLDHKSIQTPPREIGLHAFSKAGHETASTRPPIAGHARRVKPAANDPLPTHAIVAAPPIDEEERPILDGQMLMAVPSWLVSMLVHLGIVLATALFVLPRDTGPRPFELVLGEASAPMDEMEELASVEFDSSDELVEEEPTEFEEDVEFTEDIIEEPVMDMADIMPTPPTEALPLMDEPTEVELSNSGRPTRVEKIPMIAGGLGLRSAQTQLAQVIKAGGSEESEEAVARALRWIAKQQAPDGGWYLGGVDNKRRGFTSGSRNGATGLALLPFLGAGHTHQKGEYRYVVQRGLEFLMKKMVVDGVGKEATAKLTDSHGNYYSHGLCTIAMCEAYAMTHDRQLIMPAQQLINETVESQNPSGGGWRYSRRSPKGDTSVLGWQLMAAKSGKLAYLKVPERTFRRAGKFLNSVQGNYGATYGYTGANAKMSTTAVGLLSRMYLGWDRDHPGLEKGVLKLANHGPSKDEIYFSYYATQVLHHYGGPQWRAWNREMRDSLVKAQSRAGKKDGSWKFNSGHCSERLYCTSMATMILEVYYRHMPLYQHKVAM